MVASSVTVITALTPYIGYEESAKLAKEALKNHLNVADLVVERGLMARDELERVLSPERLSGLEQ
jgi:aspartate ammonia-lyase